MKVAIHQPQYFPWSPYVHKVMSADIFVYLDTVQFSKNGVQNRNQIKTSQGAHWLTIPVEQRLGQLLCEARVAQARTGEKHWKTIQANYARSEGFARWQSELKSLFETDSNRLVDWAVNTTEWLLQKLKITSRRIKASEIQGATGSGSKLVSSICKSLGADTYLTGTGALAYLEPADFVEFDCRLLVQRWERFTYQQEHPQHGFVHDLSALDLLLNCPDTARDMIEAAGSWRPLDSA